MFQARFDHPGVCLIRGYLRAKSPEAGLFPCAYFRLRRALEDWASARGPGDPFDACLCVDT